MQLIDSHSHIDFSEFDPDRTSAIKRAGDAGVTDIIVSATTAKRWSLIKDICKVQGNDDQAQCHPAYGLHPMFMNEHKSDHVDDLKHWIKNENPIALGEIGLDYFIGEANNVDGARNRQSQLALFIAQLALADECGLPVIIHARKSLDIVLKHLRQFPNVTGSIHSFSGSEQQAKQLIDLGFYLGFGGPITYTRATRLKKLVTHLPLESLLLETDSPDQPDALHYKQRNEPAYVVNVAEVVAKCRKIAVEEVAKITTQNAQTLFNFNRHF
ncbi:MAG: TatD family hydrolase [Cocleimonas sp.]